MLGLSRELIYVVVQDGGINVKNVPLVAVIVDSIEGKRSGFDAL
jgi:hypothetical protein